MTDWKRGDLIQVSLDDGGTWRPAIVFDMLIVGMIIVVEGVYQYGLRYSYDPDSWVKNWVMNGTGVAVLVRPQAYQALRDAVMAEHDASDERVQDWVRGLLS